jgi:hypothetical protein
MRTASHEKQSALVLASHEHSFPKDEVAPAIKGVSHEVKFAERVICYQVL